MEKIEFTRIEKAILSILYEVYPLSMDANEIFSLIKERGLLEMSDEEFNLYIREIQQSKRN